MERCENERDLAVTGANIFTLTIYIKESDEVDLRGHMQLPLIHLIPLHRKDSETVGY
jgi:hypothetical protein